MARIALKDTDIELQTGTLTIPHISEVTMDPAPVATGKGDIETNMSRSMLAMPMDRNAVADLNQPESRPSAIQLEEGDHIRLNMEGTEKV